MTEHHFNIEEAKKYGIEKAILLYNLRFWLEKNQANKTNIHEKEGEEYCWTYNSAAAFAELFPYMNAKSISKWLLELEKEGVLITGRFNKKGYDKTKWYTMPEFRIPKQMSISPLETSIAPTEQSIPPGEQPIPDNKPDINTNIPMVPTGQLPLSRGKTYITRVLSIYYDLFRDKYGFEPTINIGRFGKSLKELMVNKTELQVSALLIVFFNWHGMTGSDGFEHEKLLKAAFNPAWFFSTVTQYEAYLRNVALINFDNEQKLINFVVVTMNKLKPKVINSYPLTT